MELALGFVVALAMWNLLIILQECQLYYYVMLCYYVILTILRFKL
jgi:hypothetical protein